MNNQSELEHTILETASVDIQKANELMLRGELIEAEALLHKHLAEHSDDPLALYGLSQLAGLINDLEVQEVLLGQAIEQLIDSIEPKQRAMVASWLTQLAEVLFKLNRNSEAQECLAQCEALIDKNFTNPYN